MIPRTDPCGNREKLYRVHCIFIMRNARESKGESLSSNVIKSRLQPQQSPFSLHGIPGDIESGKARIQLRLLKTNKNEEVSLTLLARRNFPSLVCTHPRPTLRSTADAFPGDSRIRGGGTRASKSHLGRFNCCRRNFPRSRVRIFVVERGQNPVPGPETCISLSLSLSAFLAFRFGFRRIPFPANSGNSVISLGILRES